MRQPSNSARSLRNWSIAWLVLAICTGMPKLLAAALVTQEEVNSVRLYKQMAKSTVLVASAYVSPHQIGEGSGKGLGSGILIDEAGTIVTNAHVVHAGRTSFASRSSSTPQNRGASHHPADSGGCAILGNLNLADCKMTRPAPRREMVPDTFCFRLMA